MSRIFTSLDISTVTLNGKKFDGWAEGDSLVFPDASEIAQFVKGADGKMSASSTGEKGGGVTIKLLPNSPLVNFMQTQVLAITNGAAITWEGSVIFSDGSTAAMEKGVLLKTPMGYTLGKGSAKDMSYIFEFEVIDFETITGNF